MSQNQRLNEQWLSKQSLVGPLVRLATIDMARWLILSLAVLVGQAQPASASAEDEAVQVTEPPTVAEWSAQIAQSLVQVTGVRVETTETGVQVVLETAKGELATPATRTVGDTLIVDFPNAVLALPAGESFEAFSPAEGIALVSVTNEPGDQVQVVITGSDAPPVAEVTATGLAVTLEEVVAGDGDDVIKIIVTGEQDEGYAPSDATDRKSVV